MSGETDFSSLVNLASAARKNAYSPYSEFSVGAALETASGEIFCGCNVENLSFGLTICAERVAVGQAILMGHRNFSRIAVVASSEEPVVPCGACRQVLAEFAEELEVVCATVSGKVTRFELSALLPVPKQGILG